MSTPDNDDQLRRRLHELRDEETRHAPDFERICEGRRADSGAARTDARFLGWPAWAAAVAVLLVLAGGAWLAWRDEGAVPRSPQLAAEVEIVEMPDMDFPPADEWTTATDGLLAEAEGGAAAVQVERLTREIAVLLQP